MRFLALVATFIGLAAAVPAPEPAPVSKPSKVKIRGVSLLGSGCPAGTADTGPGTMAIDWRKNCKLTLNMEFDSGFQFSILDTDMIGFAEIPKGVKGQCSNVFSFTGGNPPVTYAINLVGKYSGNFDLHSSPGIESWSPCGGSTAILNMNTACNISPTHLPALIAVDHISGRLKVKFAVKWRHCLRK
ncbi:hypothetical protein ACCO45_012301 [Purpureocillium lilacinum]|uniref:Uncharacterized protein n=1 Tax=Purpureocillium lilacinum TaxID=33203 RepID=A0ACC4DAQ3_PURLI